MVRSNLAPIALVRSIPVLFPLVFVGMAASGALVVLYVALALHLLIIAAELTIGRLLADTAIPRLIAGSDVFEDSCLLLWIVLHIAALTAVLYFVATAELSLRQIFAASALFGYSINTFSAAAGHELLHRNRPLLRASGHLLFAIMLYPHFPTVHLSSHHRWVGMDQDCQTPKSDQTIHGYLVQAFVGGLHTIRTAQVRAQDRHLGLRALLSLLLFAIPLAFAPAVTAVLIVQGAFGFLVIETINFVQHCRTPHCASTSADDGYADHTHQDLNFVSRAMLFNLPFHAAHHDRPQLHYADLAPAAHARTLRLGYWCSFWLVWLPPLWHILRHNHSLYGGTSYERS